MAEEDGRTPGGIYGVVGWMAEMPQLSACSTGQRNEISHRAIDIHC